MPEIPIVIFIAWFIAIAILAKVTYSYLRESAKEDEYFYSSDERMIDDFYTPKSK